MTRLRAPALPAPRDLGAALLWIVVIVPGGFGFWLVAGDLAGVLAGQRHELLAASILAVGIATLVQVAAGCRMAVFEGPAATYLAAMAVIALSNPSPAEATGGLLIAGALVFALGLLGADRAIARLFTPPVVGAFLLSIVVLAAPPTIERALEIGDDSRLGTLAGWSTALIVVAIAIGAQRGRWRPYALLFALLGGAAFSFAVTGPPDLDLGSWGLEVPSPFPWGTPQLDISIATPFLVGGLLASFNTVASIQVMSAATERGADRGANRRGLIAHGAAQTACACLGNVLGNVPRLDSVGVVRLIDNPARTPLVLASVGMIALAFFGPGIELLAAVPVSVSASLLAVVLSVLVDQGLRLAATMDQRTRWLVLAPGVIPSVVWLPLAGHMSETAQLFANPLLIGVGLAVVLDRTAPRGLATHPNGATIDPEQQPREEDGCHRS